jgi:hypothetical protein
VQLRGGVHPPFSLYKFWMDYMNLLQIRTQFRKLSGRFDLVDSTFADTGADFFINEGRKYLDRMDETQKSWASRFKLLNVGNFSVSVEQCRAIKEVWLATTEGRWQLVKKNLQDLIAGYLSGLPSSRTNGTPLYYSPCLTRHIPENIAVSDLGAFIGFVETPAGNANDYNTILLNAPVDKQSMIDVRGLYYSMELIDDTDKNYWSDIHPGLLIKAAMREIEIFNRNTQGVKDWEYAIDTEMKQLGMDLVEQLISEVSEMEG